MKSKIKISIAKQEDFEAFYQLITKTLKEGYFLYSPHSSSFILQEGLSKKSLWEEFKKGNKPLYLAYIDGQLVGYLLTFKSNGGVAFGHWLAVDRGFQRRGVALALLKFWEREAKKQGAHKLQLWTTENDIQFYKKVGFTLGGEFPDSWYGLDHYLFYKTLRKSSEKNFLRKYLKSKY